MWWTPWDWSLRTAGGTLSAHERRLVLAAVERPVRDELDHGLEDEDVAKAARDRVREGRGGRRVRRELGLDRERGLLLHAVRARADEDVPARLGEGGHDLAN